MTEPEVPPADRRYEAYRHEAMKAEVETGNDPAEAGAIGGQWSALAGRLEESTRALAGLARRSEEFWQGGGAERMRAALTRFAGWSDEAASVSSVVGESVCRQADIAARAKAEMPDPVGYQPDAMIRDAAASGNILRMVGLSDAMAARRAEAEAARLRAVDVMNARDGGLRAAVPRSCFGPPPSLGAS
jgi:hypothetical protein